MAAQEGTPLTGGDGWLLAALAAVVVAHGLALCVLLARCVRSVLVAPAVRASVERVQRRCADAWRTRQTPGGEARAAGGGAGAGAAQARAARHVRPSGPLRLPVPRSDDMSLTGVVAIDCEMVGVGFRGLQSIVASVCVINEAGNVLYYSLVQPREPVTDHRTAYSGMTREMLQSAEARPFAEVRRKVAALLEGRICVGHSVDNDFIVMAIDHPARLTRDTAHDVRRFKAGSRPRKLKHLAAELLGLKIQRGAHDAAEDARASLYIYLAFREEFEQTARRRAARAGRREQRARAAELGGEAGVGGVDGGSDVQLRLGVERHSVSVGVAGAAAVVAR